jgi:hypothetical protein
MLSNVSPQRRPHNAAHRVRRAKTTEPPFVPPSLAARSRLRSGRPQARGQPRAVQGDRTSSPGARTLHSRAEEFGSGSSFAANFWRRGNWKSHRARVSAEPPYPTSASPHCPFPTIPETKGTLPPKRRCSPLALHRSQAAPGHYCKGRMTSSTERFVSSFSLIVSMSSYFA